MAAEDPAVCVITAAMRDGTASRALPRRIRTASSTWGSPRSTPSPWPRAWPQAGPKPFFAVYSTFLQRGYDQIVHDVALQNLHAVFLIGHAGLVGEDGATHQGAFDLSFLTHVPNLTLLAPSCAQELAMMLRWAKDASGPVAIRYPKAESAAAHNIVPLQKGDWQVVSVAHRAQAVVFAVGSMVGPAMMAADTLALEGLEVEVVNCRKVKPLPDRMLEKYARLPIVTLEENAVLAALARRWPCGARSSAWARASCRWASRTPSSRTARARSSSPAAAWTSRASAARCAASSAPTTRKMRRKWGKTRT